jgi:hypothetical protein
MKALILLCFLFALNTYASFVVKDAPPTVKYIPNFLTDAEEAEILELIREEGKDAHWYQDRKNHSYQNLAASLSKKGELPKVSAYLWSF